jgi:cytidylate kinase
MAKTIDLKKYLLERDSKKDESFPSPKPVVTISREFGCSAKLIAGRLNQRLNDINSKDDKKKVWKWINKEILSESARELNVDVKRIRHIFESEEQGFFGELIKSHTERYYTSDKKIKQAINKVIRNFIDEGHVIIVGRGGVSIARNHPKSLHIMLQAPFEWRVEQVSKQKNISIDKVIPYTREIDLKRKVFRDYFLDKESDCSLFDLMLNRMTLSEDEIIDVIVTVMKSKKLI